jgi:5-methyltetrahydrofolate--homocysteine methyltransferase
MTRIPSLLQLAEEKVIVLDGAMGTMLQNYTLSLDDFAGQEGCNEILVETRPEIIKAIHNGYFEAGCDAVETNTFGANGIVFAEYGLVPRTLEINRIAAQLAREAADSHSSSSSPRYVIGSVGPGTRLPSLGHIDFDTLRNAFLPQMQGLIQGGADAICIETCQDLLQVKAAIDAARKAYEIEQRQLPIFVSITIEQTGTMLVGSDLQTAIAALRPMGIDVLGLNCATGPSEMKRHVEHLSQYGPHHIMAMPNAGLPETVDGNIVYTLTPEQFADWVEGFVADNKVGFVGGCCGTTAEHLKVLVDRVGQRPAPVRTIPPRAAEAASLFQAVPLRQIPPPLLYGERTNSNGSKEFRRYLLANDTDGMLSVAREQEKGGAHLLDVSVAYVGRDEASDMDTFLQRLVQINRLPLSIDSTTPEVIEAALKRCGGRCVINSINLEDGWERLDRIAGMARRFGAAVICLAIDEQGMAMTSRHKLEVAERIYERCTAVHGMVPQDLIFDMLTFTVASGDPDSRRTGLETLEAIRLFKQRHPECLTILGVSNVSFGLKPRARKILNSVFLDAAVRSGLDQAIVNARGIIPLYRIDVEQREAAERLLIDDHSHGDPLTTYMALFEVEARPRKHHHTGEKQPADKSLHQAIVDGVRKSLETHLDALMHEGLAPVEIINTILINAMKEVGRLFGSGSMQLPFVLQSAEVMKQAVSYLRQFMTAEDTTNRGTLVLATVKGDVHDIGKNLVDIIVSNNGFNVVNLGTKIEIETMIKAAQDNNALAIGMSGLLVKSTVIMKENLEELARRSLEYPVLLGGAALTREFVNKDLRAIYGDKVQYCADAFEGLQAIMALSGDEMAKSTGPAEPDPLLRPRSESAPRVSLSATPEAPEVPESRPGNSPGNELSPPQVDYTVPVPAPPFFGAEVIKQIPLTEVFSLLNETTLFRGQWRYRRGTMNREEYERLTDNTIRPTLQEWQQRVTRENLILPQAVYGYFPCFRRGNEVHLLSQDEEPLATFQFPRKQTEPHYCVADFFRDEHAETRDIIGLFAVTTGSTVATEVARLFAADKYQDYLHLHGLAVESAEAAAEWLHARMRTELGIAEHDKTGPQAIVQQGYRGSRYSFGYPACPDLDSQRPLFKLLNPGLVGISLSETCQMVPEYSVSAIVVHHPAAKYFKLD